MTLRPILSVVFATALWFPPAAAQDTAVQVSLPRLDVKGQFTQGSLVIGRTEPGTRITLDGKAVKVSPEGDFALSFARDAKPTATIVLTPPGGRPETRSLAISPRTWRVTRISGWRVKKKPTEAEKRAMTPEQIRKDFDRKTKIERERKVVGRARSRSTDIPYFRGGFTWPLIGRITDVFGSQRLYGADYGQPHLGLDIAAPIGSMVRAAAPGRVVLADSNLYYAGRGVFIDHGHHVTSIYVHLSRVMVKTGDYVRRGQPIGLVGKSGFATGPHLHWGVIHWRTPVDPRLLVGPMPK